MVSPLARGLRGGEPSGLLDAGIIPARAGFTPLARAAHRRRGDHPRSRGVYEEHGLPYTELCGSSPLARGLPATTSDGRTATGIIPARAGFTTTMTTTSAAMRGSSPLARGLPRRQATYPDLLGIIPARAGFTRAMPARRRRRPDHPRSRGVYNQDEVNVLAGAGSSPLARGLRDLTVLHGLAEGIIPARAGFTPPTPTPSAAPSDHPRSRGVYYCDWAFRKVYRGSSPLARGLHHYEYRRVPGRGIIPARAGFTPPPRTPPSGSRDHPRSRGVYRRIRGPGRLLGGSSPLARGLPRAHDPYAGRDRDHPRSRGVYPPRHCEALTDAGSSPLARGLPPPPDGWRGPFGIIPARAGFTT